MTCRNFCTRHLKFKDHKSEHGDNRAHCSTCKATFQDYEYVQCPCCRTKLHRGLAGKYEVIRGCEPVLRLKPVEQKTLELTV